MGSRKVSVKPVVHNVSLGCPTSDVGGDKVDGLRADAIVRIHLL